jgi:hypothetical protein
MTTIDSSSNLTQTLDRLQFILSYLDIKEEHMMAGAATDGSGYGVYLELPEKILELTGFGLLVRLLVDYE